jgi:hypothetical protein
MSERRNIQKVSLPDGTDAYFEISPSLDSYPEVAGKGSLSFEDILKSVEGVAGALGDTIKRLSPSRSAIEFGVEIGIKEGQLLAFFVQGESKANLKVTLEWGGD